MTPAALVVASLVCCAGGLRLTSPTTGPGAENEILKAARLGKQSGCLSEGKLPPGLPEEVYLSQPVPNWTEPEDIGDEVVKTNKKARSELEEQRQASLQFLNASYPPIATTTLDGVLLGWIPLSNTDLSKSVNSYSVERIYDGNLDTFGGAEAVVLDLGMLYLVHRIQLNWRVCKCMSPNAVVIQISDDGTNWTTAETPQLYVWGGRQVGTYDTYSLFRYMRIVPTNAAGVKYVAFWEIALYGELVQRTPNQYGWYYSFRAGERGFGGTEINHLLSYDGRLYATTGYWMSTAPWRPAEILQLDSPLGTWQVAYQTQWAGRIEALKVLRWTTDNLGNVLQSPIERMHGTYYMNFLGEGRCALIQRVTQNYWPEDFYFYHRPFNVNNMSARTMYIHRDSVLNTDFMFISTGTYGIAKGEYDATRPLWVRFSNETETGQVPIRPLSLTQMDGRLYFSTGGLIKRRNDGPNPTWDTVFDMDQIDPGHAEVKQSTGGVRGLSAIAHPGSPTGSSLFFAWVPDGTSEAKLYRLDPSGDDFTFEKEGSTRTLMRDYLGRNSNGYDSLATYMFANYNFITPVTKPNGEVIYMIGFEALLYGRTADEFPTEPLQTVALEDGAPMKYYSGGGYLIRHNSTSYEVREPNGRTYNPGASTPPLVAVRTMALSPFGDGAYYMGGYDPNHFAVENKAWVMRGEEGAVWKDPVPCLPELGCPYVAGNPWVERGCDWCRSWDFRPTNIAYWTTTAPAAAVKCQAVMNWLNSNAGNSSCEAAKDWYQMTRNCCAHRGCDFCRDSPGTIFRGFVDAGVSLLGVTYTCQEAFDYVDQTEMNCPAARTRWASTCCM